VQPTQRNNIVRSSKVEPGRPIHTYPLGLWFNSPQDAQAAGCPATVTRFNGDHNVGIQVLSTRNLRQLEGPLKQLVP